MHNLMLSQKLIQNPELQDRWKNLLERAAVLGDENIRSYGVTTHEQNLSIDETASGTVSEKPFVVTGMPNRAFIIAWSASDKSSNENRQTSSRPTAAS